MITNSTPTTITTPTLSFQRFFAATGATPASYTTLPIASTAPSGDGHFNLTTLPCESRFNFGKFLFFANGTAGSSFKAKIVGNQSIGGDWLPITLADVTCTLGAEVLSTGERIVSAITVNNSLVVASYAIGGTTFIPAIPNPRRSMRPPNGSVQDPSRSVPTPPANSADDSPSTSTTKFP